MTSLAVEKPAVDLGLGRAILVPGSPSGLVSESRRYSRRCSLVPIVSIVALACNMSHKSMPLPSWHRRPSSRCPGI